MPEALVLEASVVDRFSEPLGRLKKQVADIANRESQQRLKDQAEAFKRVKEQAGELGESLKRVVEPAMAAVGLSALSLGGALAGIVEGARHAGQSIANLKRLGDTLEVPVQFIKDQEALFRSFGIGADQADAALSKFKQSFRDLQHGIGELHNTLADYDPSEDALLKQIKSYPQAVEEWERYLNSIKDPVKRARLSALGFGSEDEGVLGTATRKQFEAAVAESKRGSEKVSGALVAASQEWEKSWIGLSNTFAVYDAAFDAAEVAAADASDTDVYRALVTLHSATVSDLSTRSIPLPNLVTYSFGRSYTALGLAQRLYTDPTRAEQLVGEGKVVHPYFMPPTGRALSA
jgi:hypothetical protein